MKTLLVVVPVLFLAGCATNKLDQGLAGLVGKNVDAAVAQLGAPSTVRQVGDAREIEWRSAKSVFASAPPPGNSGFYLSRSVSFTPVPLPLSTPSPGPVLPPAAPSTLSSPGLRRDLQFCKVTLQVDRQDVIRSYRYDGDFDGCYGYARALGGRA